MQFGLIINTDKLKIYISFDKLMGISEIIINNRRLKIYRKK
ncbi:hypothetical protein AO382_0951 [Moraxella catarrhalis]|uniref:Uncharacterized protein n=1 Tax=Moraxella catarrhalis TaxID=480 RepID=A0A7Z1A4B2_MORCA|nr:hypothetical protein AO382_0951 [Moraxella catarrhalis]